MRLVLFCLTALVLAAPSAAAKAKEKANKTKCSNALRKMEAVADRGIEKMDVRRRVHQATIDALRMALDFDLLGGVACCPLLSSCKAKSVSRADWHRSSGSFSRQRSTNCWKRGGTFGS